MAVCWTYSHSPIPFLSSLCVQELSAALSVQGEQRTVTVTVAADPALGTLAGGVILTAFDGKIRCCNTLEERLATALVDLTPVVRDLLVPSARAGMVSGRASSPMTCLTPPPIFLVLQRSAQSRPSTSPTRLTETRVPKHALRLAPRLPLPAQLLKSLPGEWRLVPQWTHSRSNFTPLAYP